ncbi:MAG: CBS domain-containing protein [Saprospiraceae bacterium]|nr:CBS domain-containing protein [Saprospiraceae bacterium]MCB0622782.1 CBS domain-containing protein [Saprospiraceae bacterium]MCB0677938.1 CBS domain-containing protein [Saprospiraceae bacterium]MCB0682357.1 CBS domain-containing protein [Saprospiraceae bacterium]
MNLQIGDIMTKNVLVAQQHYSFTQVCRLFFAMKIHHLPIVDDRGALVGILSTNDVLNIYSFRAPMLPSLSEDSLNAAFSIGEIMTKNPKTIGPQAGLAEAARIFSEEGIQSLPVVEDNKLVGIVTSHDLINNWTLQPVVSTEEK